MFVFMLGNISEGYKAVGPFEDFDTACEWGEGYHGWIMELNHPDDDRAIHEITQS